MIRPIRAASYGAFIWCRYYTLYVIKKIHMREIALKAILLSVVMLQVNINIKFDDHSDCLVHIAIAGTYSQLSQ